MKQNKIKNLFEFFEYLSSNTYLIHDEKILITTGMENIIEDIKDKKIQNPYIFIYFLYLNNNHIHKILYEDDIIISLEKEDNVTKDLLCSLPLALLILDDNNKTDFQYSFDFINNFNKSLKKEKEKYKKVILSMVLIDLIDNYKGLDDYYYDFEKNKKIESIKNYNNKIITNNIDSFNKFESNMDNIKSNNQKESELKEELNVKKIFEEYLNNIINQLCLNFLLKKGKYDIDINLIFKYKIKTGLGLSNYKSDFFKKSDISSGKNVKDYLSSASNKNGNNQKKYPKIQNILNMSIEEKGKKYTVEFITQLGKYFFIGFNITLFIYDENKNLKKERKIEWINNIINIKERKESNEGKLDISICTRDKIKFFKCKEEDIIDLKKELSKNLKPLYLMKRDNLNEYYICMKDNAVLISNENSGKVYKIFSEEDFMTKSGIILNNNIMIFKSNKVISKGKDKIKLYNFQIKNISDILQENEEYSFIFSPNGLETMNIGIKNKNKVLLCACKKYIKNQKNGILVVNFEDTKYINHFFHETNNFEVYCICPISIIIEDNITVPRKTNATRFFFAGGFDLKKRKGIIKIYKLINKGNYCQSIEYMLDYIIKDDNNKDIFKEPISCITQSIKEEKIFIGCWDGKVISIEFLDPAIRDYLHKFEKPQSNCFNIFFPKIEKKN